MTSKSRIDALFGLAVNLITFDLVLRFWVNIPLETTAQAIDTAAGMGLNFIGSKFLVFRVKQDDQILSA